jgi:hypothetical protein
MVLDPIFDRFVADSPLSVMTRATIEHALSAEARDALFERTADKQYTRERRCCTKGSEGQWTLVYWGE